MQRCPNCSTKIKHYSTKKLYKSNRRYYKCENCGTNFITAYEITEVVIKINGEEKNDLDGC